MSIYIRFKKTNRSFDNVHSAQNHARHHYESMEDAYCDAHDISNENKPLCTYCGNVGEFISLGKGYHNRCSADACKTLNVINANKGIAQRALEKVTSNVDFHNYVLMHSDYYKKIIVENKPYYDTYLNRHFTNPSFQLRNYLNRSECVVYCKCVLTDVEYQVNVFYSESDIDYYFSPEYGTRTYRKYFNRDEALKILEIRERYDLNVMTLDEFNKNVSGHYSYKIIRLIVNHFYNGSLPRTAGKTKPKIIREPAAVICGVNLYSTVNSFTGKLRDILLNTKLTLSDIRIVYPDAISKCKECKNDYIKDRVYYNIYENSYYARHLRNEHACSQKCYFALLKYRKVELYYESTPEDRARQSKLVRDKINRGEFTPHVTNSWCRSRIDTKDGLMHFRSTWEAVFYSVSTARGIALEYEKIRIKYYDPIQKKHRNYIVDFVDEKHKILYEIKPNGEKGNDRTIAKANAAISWANDNGYSYTYISDEWFKENSVDILEKTLYYCSIEQDTLVRRVKQFLVN